ncbi:autotransporter [Helicobacter valdiviensis]|uniref:Autotransporter n=1 Tax=Helicobacter valdiviensis TaxID=1458358 RepID=A0A2W6MUM5_9HELI|nr:autotransporter [Helicobacter valdiviensis]
MFLNSFSNHLYDNNGVKFEQGMRVVKTQDEVDEALSKGEKVFLIDPNIGNQTGSLSTAWGHTYFIGENVLEVIKNAKLGYDGINGIPINGWEGDDLDVSHVELDNSLMSHQSWRNYLFYMEAELALLQDLGYEFDRKLYYGDSIYESDLKDWQSNHGYFARKDGEWLEGVYNPTEYGVGLHIYGKNNTVTQNHDILSSGVAASGIRIDGTNNKLTISNGVKVHTLGDYSNALLIAYGKEHIIHQNGELKATGKDGIAININFGDNTLGNSEEYRGSYMLEMSYKPNDIKHMLGFYNLNGALVDTLNLSSTSSTIGSLASIYIADNAYVKTINIAKNANIKGDIISNWNPNNDKLLLDEYKNQFFTELNFGNASSVANFSLNTPNNAWSVKANIVGYDSFKMNVNEDLNLQGSAFVYDLNNKANFTLLSKNLQNSILYIKNNFMQNSNASLSVSLNGNGKANVYVGNNANLGGNLNFYIGKDYYKSGTLTLDKSNIIQANGTINGSFSNINYDSSLNTPSYTLDFSYDSTKQELQIQRDYQPFAKKDADISLANALNALSIQGNKEDISLLFSELDFLQDKKQISKALNNLNANAYLDSAKISLDFQEKLNKELLDELHQKYEKDWQSSISTFGDYQNLKANGDFNSYKGYNTGLKFKTTKNFNHLNFSFNAILNNNNFDIDDNFANTKTKGAYAGIFAKYSLEDFYLFLGLRGGFEHTKLNRTLSIGSFNANYNSKFNSYLSSEILGFGKSFNYENFNFGPLVYLEHNFLHRQNFNEENTSSTALQLDSKNFNMLNSFIGLDINYTQNLNANTLMNLAFLGGYSHAFLDSLKNNANFKGASANSFYAKSNLNTKDSLYLQGEIGFNFRDFFFSKLQLSSNIHKDTDFKGRIEMGIKF